RESRIALQEQLSRNLIDYVELVSEKLLALCSSPAVPQDTAFKASLDACQLEYSRLQDKISVLQEEAVKLKSREIAVSSLENELRKAYSE
ncbi:MAG: hypothetical protein JXP39_03720, partial [Spirochaetales bacterium]|nr:hypothetical protein [Spirochaetales bacterium]